MKRNIFFSLTFLFSVPAWSQVVSPIMSSGQTSGSSMQIPGPVSINYSGVQLGSEAISNYIRGDLGVSGSYVDNLFTGQELGTHSETITTLLPEIAYNWVRPRQARILSYSPGFTFYQPDSSLNQVNQAASAAYLIRPAEHVTVMVNDLFTESSYSSGQGQQNTIPNSYTPRIVPAYAQQMSNIAQGEVAVQTGIDVMVGASGIMSLMHYPNPSQTIGLYDSSSRGSTAFYARRLTRGQSLGFQWQYLDYLTDIPNANNAVQTNGFLGFYTLAINEEITISVSAGPQSYRTKVDPLPAATGWTPSVSASLGWHKPHFGLSLSGSRDATGGGGEVGAFTTSNAIVAAQWRMARTWTAGMYGNYTNLRNEFVSFGSHGGHSISGGVDLDHPIGKSMTVSVAYNRVHQKYPGIGSIAANPNSNSGMVGLTWHFTRPLGN